MIKCIKSWIWARSPQRSSSMNCIDIYLIFQSLVTSQLFSSDAIRDYQYQKEQGYVMVPYRTGRPSSHKAVTSKLCLYIYIYCNCMEKASCIVQGKKCCWHKLTRLDNILPGRNDVWVRLSAIVDFCQRRQCILIQFLI